MRKTRKVSEWQSLISEFNSSDISVEDFCRRKSLSSSTFWKWRRKIEKSCTGAVATESSFVPLVPSSTESVPPAVTHSKVRLTLPEGFTIEIERF
jgi:transposase-like protein